MLLSLTHYLRKRKRFQNSCINYSEFNFTAEKCNIFPVKVLHSFTPLEHNLASLHFLEVGC